MSAAVMVSLAILADVTGRRANRKACLERLSALVASFSALVTEFASVAAARANHLAVPATLSGVAPTAGIVRPSVRGATSRNKLRYLEINSRRQSMAPVR